VGRKVAVEVAVEFGSGVLVFCIVGRGGTVAVGLVIEVLIMDASAVD
jgi:hypothetical protein